MNKEEERKYLKCQIEDCGNRANLIVIGKDIICMNYIEKAFYHYKKEQSKGAKDE